jgi:hypothetical protein
MARTPISKQAPRPRSEARYELRDMTTKEVSMVDLAANLRKFLITKRDPMPTDIDPNAPAPVATETKKAMALPGEARTALIDGVMDALEKLTGVTQALKEATIDDGVQVPDELPRMIKEASDGLAKIAGSYIAKSDPPAPTVEDTEKARRLTARRRAAIETAANALNSLLTETEDESGDGGNGAGDDDSGTTAKVMSEVLDAVKLIGVKFDELSTATAKATADASAKADAAATAVETLKAALTDVGSSQSRGPDGEGDGAPAATKVIWEDDFAAQVMNKANG